MQSGIFLGCRFRGLKSIGCKIWGFGLASLGVAIRAVDVGNAFGV